MMCSVENIGQVPVVSSEGDQSVGENAIVRQTDPGDLKDWRR